MGEGFNSSNVPLQQDNLDALLGLLAVDDSNPSSHKAANPQILLPLFQLLAHLVALPSHRRTVAAWPTPSSKAPVSSLLNHLLLTISQPTSGLRSSAAAGNKLQIAALDLLASLVKDEPIVADVVRQWRRPDEDGELFMDALWTLVRGKEAGVRVAAAAWWVFHVHLSRKALTCQSDQHYENTFYQRQIFGSFQAAPAGRSLEDNAVTSR